MKVCTPVTNACVATFGGNGSTAAGQGIQASCAQTGLSDHSPAYPPAGLNTGIVGAVMTNDSANTSDTNGGAMTAAITDGTRF